MTTMYVVRHCETTGNKARTFQGTSNTNISEMGAKQLELLSSRFETIKFDKIYTSPLKRAYKTALAISAKRGIAPIIRENLIELNGGIIEGMPYTEIYEKFPDLEICWLTRTQDFDPPEGESMRKVYERIWEEVISIAKENEGKTICISTHGGVIKALLCRVLKNDIEKIMEIPWNDNTAVNKLIFDDDFNCIAEFINDTTHLPKEFLPKENSLAAAALVNK